MMNSVVHFEMPYVDPERMATFYQSVFGWQTKHLGEAMGDYMLATTTETDQRGPRKPGAINGGFFPKQNDRPSQGPSIVIAVDNLDAAIERVRDGGGRVLGEPMQIPGVGHYVSFTDPEGNQLSMLQPSSEWQSKEDAGGREARTSSPGARHDGQQEWSPKRAGERSPETAAHGPARGRDDTSGSRNPTRRKSG
ncbi:MAG TPA: VOC family protein [Candidatus Krumholzibacteria bacterium]